MLPKLRTLYAQFLRRLDPWRTMEATFLDGRSIEPIYNPPFTQPCTLESFDSSYADRDFDFAYARFVSEAQQRRVDLN